MCESSPSFLQIQPQIGLLLCTMCNVLLANQRCATRHLQKPIHPIKRESISQVVKKAFSEATEKQTSKMKEVLSLYEKAPFSTEGGPCEPLPSLVGVKVEKGYSCAECLFFAKTSQTLRDHLRGKMEADEPFKLEERLSECLQNGTVLMQSLLLGVKTRYFPVFETGKTVTDRRTVVNADESGLTAPRSIDSGETVLLQPYIDLISEEKTPAAKILKGSDEKMLNEFISRTRFDKILKRANRSMEKGFFLSGKDTNSGQRRVEEKLRELSVMYLKAYPNVEECLSPNILQKFSLKPDHSFRYVSGKTLDSYGRVLGRFVVSAYRHCLENCTIQDNSQCEFGPLKSLVSSCEAGTKGAENFLVLFHETVKSLCLVRSCEIDGVEGLFVRSFLACCSVHADRSYEGTEYRFVHSYEMSPIAAVVQYVISYTALVELLVKRKMCESEGRSPELIESTSKMIESNLISKLRVDANTAASFVRFVLNICSRQNENYTTESRFVMCENHSLCGFLKGIELSMEDLGRFLRKWQSVAEDIMRKDLMLGGQYPLAHEGILFGMKDDVTNRCSGYSFLDHCENKSHVISLSAHVLEAISRNGKGTRKIFACDFDRAESSLMKEEVIRLGEHILIRSGVEKWLRKCQDLQEILLTCLHLSSGSPARATEIASYKLSNTQWGLRNIYIVQNRIHVLSRYSKQRNNAGKDKPVLRIPDKMTSFLLKKYFVLFRSIEAKFVKALHGASLETSHLENAFSCIGESFSPERIRQIIRHSLKSEGKDMGIADYRNHSAAMVRLIAHHSMRFISAIIDEFASNGHEQAGHSMRVADRIYGRSVLDFGTLSADDLNRHKSWALDYHRALFQWEKCQENSETASDVEVNELSRPLTANNSKPDMDELVEKVSEIGAKVDKILGKRKGVHDIETGAEIRPVIQKKRLAKEKNHSRSSVSLLAPSTSGGEREALYLLPYLRKMMGDRNAVFRSQVQADICSAILASADNVFAIAATGFGKSLCFLLPIYIAGAKYCSIVIVPLVSLAAELLTKCQKYGISAETWQDKTDQAQVLICAAEHVSSEAFKVRVRMLTSQDRLRWIVIDEAHLSYEWEDFREKLEMIKYGLSCVTSRVKRVLLTATAAPNDRESIMIANGIRSASFFISDTLRRNLKISVRIVKEKVGEKHGVPFLTSCLLRILRAKTKLPDRIIVFTMGISDVETIAENLDVFVKERRLGEVLRYHGGMNAQERSKAHKIWRESGCEKEKIPLIVVCTSAFGAGVDVPNVREVYHIGGSQSLTQYAQEIGRAGRDGQLATCTLLYSQSFESRRSSFLGNKIRSSDIYDGKGYDTRRMIAWNEFSAWATDSYSCKKASLYQHIDGLKKGLCLYDETSANCDFCDFVSTTSYANDIDTQHTTEIRDAHAELITTTGTPPFSTLAKEVVTSERCSHESPERDRDSRMQRGSEISEDFIETCTPLCTNIPVPNSHEDLWMKYERISMRLKGLCVCCIGRYGKEVRSSEGSLCNRCSDLLGECCYRCLSPHHKTRECPLPKWVNGHCTNCGIRSFPSGQKLHTRETFGRKCQWLSLNKLFWALWRKDDKTRTNMLEELVSESDALKLRNNMAECNGAESSIFLKSLLAWLHNRKGIPNHARILFWVDSQLQ